MYPTILGRRNKGDGTTELTITLGSRRFTGTIPTAMVGTEDELNMVRAMGDRVGGEVERLEEITKPGRQEYA